jgi:hypothetical protein
LTRKLLAAALLACAPFVSSSAQSADSKQVLSIQPLSLVFGFYSGEYERAASKAVTWGLGANYWSIGDSDDEVSYTSTEFKLRYYPEGQALRGFSFGGSAGLSSVKGASGSSGVRKTETVPSLGVLLEYQWLMGEKKNFSVALGAGAKALFIGADEYNSSDFTAKYPTARISVGLAW